MKLLLILILLAFVVKDAVAQQRINPDKASAYVGKTVEVLGHAYYVRAVNRDFAIMKIGYRLQDARLIVYVKFKSAASPATLIKFEFVHFVGNVSIIEGKPVLIIDKLIMLLKMNGSTLAFTIIKKGIDLGGTFIFSKFFNNPHPLNFPHSG